MKHELPFSVVYMTDSPVPIGEIIDSLMGVESVLRESVQHIPTLFPGLTVESIEIRVAEISQRSPLKEIFLLTLFLTFQKDLEQEVPTAIENLTGIPVPDSMDTIVTLMTLIVVYYGIGALKDFVTNKKDDGPARRQLTKLIEEVAASAGVDPDVIRKRLEERYSDKSTWRRLANMTTRFFRPSKRHDNAPVQVNDRTIDKETVSDVPWDYIVDAESERELSRYYPDADIELHAQDRDHTGRGWAAVVPGVVTKRLRLKLLEEVNPMDVWNKNRIRGDITIVYERIGAILEAKEIHLHRINNSNSHVTVSH